MQRREEYLTLAKQIKYMKGKSRKSGDTFVIKQQTNGIVLENKDKIPLEKVIIAENLKKYHQTVGDFLWLDDSRLYSYIRDFGEFPQVEAILDSTYVCPDNTDPEVKTLLRHLQGPTTVSDKGPPTLMILAAYREYWKIVKENTSSPGPHIIMYKAAAQHPLLGWIFHHKYEITYLSGYSLRQHCTGNNVMLTKKTASYPGVWKTCAPLSYLTLKQIILTNIFEEKQWDQP